MYGRDSLTHLPARGPRRSGRKLVLVALDWHRPKDPRTPLGHASLAAAVHTDGSVDLVHGAFSVLRPENSAGAIATSILDQVRGLPVHSVDVALGAYAWNEPLIRQILPRLRASGFEGRIILGGPQVTFAGPNLEDLYPEADLFIRGYAEDALVAVVRSESVPTLPGIHVAGTPDVGSQAMVALRRLSSPFLTGIVPLGGFQPFVRWETQRGCPAGTCRFCQHRDPSARPTCAHLGAERLEAEIEHFCAAGVRDVAVLDPVFHGSKRALRHLDAFARRGWKGRLSLQCRFELVREDFLDACKPLDVRLEFGLQTIHPEEMRAIGRENDLDQADRVIADLHRRRIPFEVSIIYGLPEQTLEGFLATVDWCLARRVPVLKAFPLKLLRGTALDRERARWSLVEDAALIPRVVASSTFSPRDWACMDAVAQALVRSEGAHPSSVAGLDRPVSAAASSSLQLAG